MAATAAAPSGGSGSGGNSGSSAVHEVLPVSGLVYSEKGNLSEVLCKPRIMPIKVRGAASV